MEADDPRRCDNITGVVYEPENVDFFQEQVAPAVLAPALAPALLVPALAPAPDVVATISLLTRRATNDMCDGYNQEPAIARAVMVNTNDGVVLNYSQHQETWERLDIQTRGFI